MIPEKFKEYLTAAEAFYHSAEEEMLRGEEDVVTFKVCLDLKKTMVNYFKCYLSANHIPFSSENPDELLQQCIKIDPAFKGINISHFSFSEHDATDFINLTLDHTTDCMNMARQTRALVHQKVAV